MYLLIPVAILVASLAMISFVIIRKLGQSKRLAEASVREGDRHSLGSFTRNMFLELFNYFQQVNVSAHKSSLLLELEKFLRRSRIMFMRVDNLSNKLLHKVRETHLNEVQKSQEKQEKIAEVQVSADKEEVIADTTAVSFVSNVEVMVDNSPAAEELRRKERDIILAIAKNPKNKLLYKTLGDIYMELKQWYDAKESFSSALQLDPNIKGVKRKLEMANKMLGVTQGH